MNHLDVNHPGLVARLRPHRPDAPSLAPAVAAQAARWQQHLGRLSLGVILVAAALAVDGLAVAPGRLDVALLSVAVAVMATARLAGFWASLLTAFAAAVLIDLQWPYPAGTGAADRPLDLAALCAFALVVLLGGSALARNPARAAGSPAALGAAPAADGPAAHGPAAGRHVAERIAASMPAAIPLPEPLTARETEILVLVARGLSNDEIAGRLVVSTNTVKTHLSHAYAKLGATSRTGAVARARAAGITGDAELASRG